MLDLPAEINVLSLKKPSSVSNAPRQRLSDADKAQSLVGMLVYADQERSWLNARVKGMLDGNAPYAWEELKRQGQAARTNVNFREGEAALEAGVSPYYDLFAESDTYCKVEVGFGDVQQRVEWSRHITEEFDSLLKEWQGFDWNSQAIFYDMVSYGRGFAMFPNKSNWQFKAVRQSKVLVPDGTPSDPDQLEILVVRESSLVHELYNKIRDSETAKRIGWNIQAVLEAIASAMPEYNTDNAKIDYEMLQQEMRNHDIYQTMRSDVVKIAHLFVREFDGKVSHLIIQEQSPLKDGKVPSSKFLFKKIGRFDSFRQAVTPVFFDIGDGTWHSIKGLAVKLYPFIEIKNRLNCSIVDNCFINMSVLARPTTGSGEEATAIMQLGPLSILPSNLEIQQWGLAGKMEEGLAVEKALSLKLDSNIGQYRRPMTRETGNPPTAHQVSYDAAKEAALSKGSVNRFYTQMDMLFEEIFRRASDLNLVDDDGGPNTLAMKFQDRVMQRGVPKVAFKKIKSVRATRNIGNGSVFVRQQTILSTAQFVPLLNEAGRQNWLDSAIAVLAGSENVERWNPKQTLPSTLADEQAYAILENNSMQNGGMVAWTQTQNNIVHATAHLRAAAQAAQSLPQGADPARVASFLQALGQHTSVHLAQIKRDPTQANQVRIIEQQLNQISGIIDSIQTQLEAAQKKIKQRQQRQQQVMTDIQLDQVQTNAKIADQRRKTDEALRLKQEKHDQQLQLADAKTATDITLKRLSAESDNTTNGSTQ